MAMAASIVSTSIFLSLVGPVVGEWPISSDQCTSIAVDRDATLEGSGLATHNNDCNNCDPRVAFIPARDHEPGAKRPVQYFRLFYPRMVGAYRSETYAPVDGQKDTEPIGYIDQVPHTYSYWEGAYPLINEHGLGFGESTCTGFLVGQSKVDGGEAIMSVAELMQVALERCKTARCAIQTMGDLGVEHGFYGEDPGVGGAGESLAVTDPDETWVFHITGGLKNTSATWVAQKVPSGHVAVVANNFIIRKIDCDDSNNFMCSHNVFSNAREMNLCKFNSQDDFDFLKCYTPDIRTFNEGGPGTSAKPYYTTLRMWGIYQLVNPTPGVAPPLSDSNYGFPFSIPVAAKVSRTDVMNWTRYYYQGTEYDMSQGVLAGPFNNPTRVEAGNPDVPGTITRGISIARTSYSLVVESKRGEKARQSIAWFAADQPLTSVFAPFVASSTKAADAYHKGRLEVFSRDSAFWAFQFVSNWMNINYKDMHNLTVGPAQRLEQQRLLDAVGQMEADWPRSIEAVNEAQHHLQTQLVRNWWALADTVIAQFSDGAYTTLDERGERVSKGLGLPAWWLEMIGFNTEFTQVQWAQPSAMPPVGVLKYLPVAFQLKYLSASTNFLAAVDPSGFNPMVLAMFSSLLVGTMVGYGAGRVATSTNKGSKVQDISSPLLAQ